MTSCGQSNPHRHFEKQRTSSDIKISSLDLEKRQIKMRFEYRSYITKKFEHIECQIKLAGRDPFTLSLIPEINFDSFSTEILTFKNIDSTYLANVLGLKNISYSLDCKVNFDKGIEYIQKESTLYLVPKLDYLFR